MKNRKTLSLLLAGAMAAALLAVPAQAAEQQPQTPAPYAISADHWSREDFSQAANPEVFTGVYSRELYNTIRQTMVDETSAAAPAYTMVAKGDDYSAVKNLIGRMEGVLRYEHHVPQGFTDYWGTWTTSPCPPRCRRTTRRPWTSSSRSSRLRRR